MTRNVSFAIAILFLAACGGDDSAAKGAYAEECMLAADCAEGLTCLRKLCTTSCSDNAQCAMHGSESACVASICLDLCADRSDCPNNLICTMQASTQGTCQAQ